MPRVIALPKTVWRVIISYLGIYDFIHLKKHHSFTLDGIQLQHTSFNSHVLPLFDRPCLGLDTSSRASSSQTTQDALPLLQQASSSSAHEGAAEEQPHPGKQTPATRNNSMAGTFFSSMMARSSVWFSRRAPEPTPTQPQQVTMNLACFGCNSWLKETETTNDEVERFVAAARRGQGMHHEEQDVSM